MGKPRTVVLLLIRREAIGIFFLVMAVFLEIMIAEYKEQGLVQGGNDVFQIVQGQIPGAEDHIYIGKSLFYGGGVYERIDLVRYA
jgi:hypothetical protein